MRQFFFVTFCVAIIFCLMLGSSLVRYSSWCKNRKAEATSVNNYPFLCPIDVSETLLIYSKHNNTVLTSQFSMVDTKMESSTFTPLTPCKNKKKIIWIMGVGSSNKDAATQYYNFVIAAINSARVNAPSLLPHIIHSGHVSTLPIGLTNMPGVKFLSHNLSFVDKLIKYQENPKSFGAFYRIDIPLLMNRIQPMWSAATVDHEYVLYTDTDVIFFDEFDACSLPQPRVMYIGPESMRGKQQNSGVLYINTTAFGEHSSMLMEFAESKKWHFAACDQGLIMQYFRDKNLSDLLPDKYNWKGYWGGDNNVVIGHFHAAKPGRCLDCYLMYRQTIEVCNCKHYEGFFRSALKIDNGRFYEKMLIAYKNYSSIKLY